MSARGSGSSSSSTALRRLMTEYKQLTSGGAPPSLLPNASLAHHTPQGSPDGMFTAGPVSEADFFTWEALICGPKDTPFVRTTPVRSSCPNTFE